MKLILISIILYISISEKYIAITVLSAILAVICLIEMAADYYVDYQKAKIREKDWLHGDKWYEKM